MYVQGGDPRRGEDDVSPASLGAVLKRDDDAGGFRVEHVYRVDPDEPQIMSPLAKPALKFTRVTLSPHQRRLDPRRRAPRTPSARQAGKQVLLEVKSASNQSRPVVVIPITPAEESNLRYSEWEYAAGCWSRKRAKVTSATFTCATWESTTTPSGHAISIRSSCARV